MLATYVKSRKSMQTTLSFGMQYKPLWMPT
jgi:hypothetical protein